MAEQCADRSLIGIQMRIGVPAAIHVIDTGASDALINGLPNGPISSAAALYAPPAAKLLLLVLRLGGDTLGCCGTAAVQPDRK